MRGGRQRHHWGTIIISVRPPHQIGHMLGGQKESKMQAAPPTKKQKGCVNTN
jgi:hypothetical protein